MLFVDFWMDKLHKYTIQLTYGELLIDLDSCLICLKALHECGFIFSDTFLLLILKEYLIIKNSFDIAVVNNFQPSFFLVIIVLTVALASTSTPTSAITSASASA